MRSAAGALRQVIAQQIASRSSRYERSVPPFAGESSGGARRPDLPVGMGIARAHHGAPVLEDLDVGGPRVAREPLDSEAQASTTASTSSGASDPGGSRASENTITRHRPRSG
jgi:hypothetical protein